MSLENIKNALLKSYQEHGGINHLDGINLPDQDTVNTLANGFMHLLFPGYFEKSCLTQDQLAFAVERQLIHLEHRLIDEIRKCLIFSEHPEAQTRATEIATVLLTEFTVIRRLLQTDVDAAYTGDPAAQSFEEIILSYPCILAISMQRIAHRLYQMEVPLLPRMLTEFAHRKTGIDIHPGATIGSHFFIDHGTGVVIGETTIIGSHVKFYQGVTLGAKSFSTDAKGNIVKGIKRHPNIGDNVTIYSGASILGGKTTIGNDSIVGANVWLMDSIPTGSIAYYRGENLVVRSRKKKEKAEGNTSYTI
ncbi:MAG: serine acetyltransferase [Opitutaceae bacterium]|nr:serine acetyltransferase [Opitutaceae bacterium]